MGTRIDTSNDTRMETRIGTSMDRSTDTNMDTRIKRRMDTSMGTSMDTNIETRIKRHMDTRMETRMDTLIGTPMGTCMDTRMDTRINTCIDTLMDRRAVLHRVSINFCNSIHEYTVATMQEKLSVHVTLRVENATIVAVENLQVLNIPSVCL